ncbi:MAG: DJ-1/PfpI family protein [Lachnospiraceae bacterium]|nr:DJ-1/PfpI family protein [Lachnospiraceae bacterium]
MVKVAIFLATGFEEIEALTVVDLLRRVHVEIDMVSVTGEKKAIGSHNIIVETDKTINQLNFNEYDMLILPGGMPGTLNLEACEVLMSQVDAFYAQGKLLAAICAAPSILGHRHMLEGRLACCYPGFEKDLLGANVSLEPVCVDGKIITSRGMGCAVEFGLKIVEILLGEEVSKDLAGKIIYE